MTSMLDRARRVAHRVAGRARRRLSGGDGGFVLLESIIAISLITVIMAAIGAEYVASVASVSRQRTAQSAAQVANSTLEQVRALRPSDLVAGRGSTSVAAQFSSGNATPTITPWLQQMDPASDANAPATSGANATIPTCDPAPQGATGPALCTQKPGNIAYTVSQFIGTCWLITSGTSSDCVPAAQKTATSVGYLRVVVSVSWRDGACSAGCYYVTSTLVNASGDPTFKANQPPLPAPVVAPPGDQSNDIGDAVNLQLGLVSGTGVPGYAWAITSGALPTGLSLDRSSGVISGVIAGPTGARPVTVQVTDGYSRTATAPFTWTIYTPPVITTPANQVTTINTSASLQLSTSCSNAPCRYTLTNAPPGLTISSAGLITGTVTVSGTRTVAVTVTDAANVSATATFSWTVLANAPVCVTGVNLPNGSFETPGVSAGAGKNVGNGTSGMAWRTNNPNGLVEYWANGGNSQSNNGGTPIAAQTGTQWVEVNGAGLDTLYQDLPTTPGQVLQWSLWHRARNATSNVNAQDSVQVQMGSTTQQGPQVPNGAVNPTISDGASAWVQYTGVYTVPAGQTTTRFQVTAISTASGNAGVGNFLDNVAVTGTPCLTSTPTAQTSTLGTPITTLQLTASQGSGSYTWSGGSTLPAGLSLSSSGLITGTPTAVGTTSVSLIVTDSTSSYQQVVPFSWTVKAAPTVATPSNQNSSVGSSVNVTVASSCPNTPCTYTLSGAPAGLSISNSGVITGTPTTGGTSTGVTVAIRDAAGATATSAAFTWTVAAGPTITTPNSQSSSVGVAVSLTVTSTCTNSPCTYSATALPAGLTINSSTGAITGTPTTAATTTPTVSITDAAGATATSASFTWTVRAAPTVTAPANQTSTVGRAVSVTVGSTCPNTPCTYALTGAPAGLSINNSGVIAGTPSATGTSSSVTVTITDAAGATASSAAFTWTVTAGPTVTTPSNQTSTVGAPVNVGIGSTCPNTPCTYTLSGAPAGLSINSATGVITGTPTTTGTSSSVTVTITDSAGAAATTNPFTWTIKAGPTVATPSNQTSSVGAAVNLTVTSTCANSPCTFTLTGAPAGLSINNSGVITGSPTTAGTSTGVTVAIRDAAAATATSAAFTWTVYAAPTVTAPANQTSSVGGTVSVTVASTCPNTPCTYTLDNPPAGLSMAGATITGTPTTAGTTTSTVTIRDAAGVTRTSSSFTWTIKTGPTVTAPANQTTSVGATVNLAVGSTCANTPCTYSVTALPAGLTINANTGTITGSPTTADTTTSTITIRDAAGATATSAAFTWTVKAGPTISSPGNSSLDVGTQVSYPPGSTCPNTPCTYSLAGAPPGLTINSSTGVVSGAPTTPGVYNAVTATITDAAGASASTTPVTVTVYARPTITSPGTQTSTINTALNLPITSTCSNTPCTYALSGAPAGLTINSSTGRITGTPTATGTSTSAKVTVTDAGGVAVDTGTFTWTITAGPSVTSPGNQSTVNNATVSLTLTTSCPNSPCAYRLNGGPAGLSITSAGVVTGTVTSAPQVFAGVTVTITDGDGATATSAAFNWTVTAPLTGRWTFDEASGSTAADASGNGHTATLSGGYGKTATAAQGANALTLNGTSNSTAIPSGTVLNTSSSFTVSAWAKLTSLSNYQTFVSQDGSQVSGFYLQYRQDTGKFAFTRLASDSSSATATVAGATKAPVTGQWYQLTGVYNSATNTLTLYVNGIRQGSPVSYSSGWNATGSFVIGRGKYNGAAADQVNGAIDDVRAYSSALSDDAVAQLAQAGYFRLDEGSGTTAQDSSLNNNAGTLSGGATWTTPIVGASAVQFNGSTAAITSGSTVLDTSQSFSVTAWAKADSTTSTGTIVSADGTNISSFLLRQDSGKWAMVSVSGDASTGATVTNVYATSNLVVGQWYLLAGVYDSVAKTVALYVNGVLQGSPVSVTGSFKASGPLVIGRSYYQGGTNYFGGAIDDVHAYRFPLDQAGVTALTTLTPPAPGTPTASAGSSSATVTWTAPTGVAGNPVTGYVITPYLSGVAQTPVSYNSTATSQTLTGLTPGGSYTFSVAALNANGTSAATAVSNAVLPS